MSIFSATSKQLSIAPGVVPQSSWSFKAHAPAFTCSIKASGFEEFPLPANAKFIEKESAACIILPICQGPGVHVVANVP